MHDMTSDPLPSTKCHCVKYSVWIPFLLHLQDIVYVRVQVLRALDLDSMQYRSAETEHASNHC
jgi:hypothetical protein